LPYVLEHLDQTFFFVFFFFIAFFSPSTLSKKLGDQQLAVSFSFALHWLLFKDKEKSKAYSSYINGTAL
jgi:hypothetical protein